MSSQDLKFEINSDQEQIQAKTSIRPHFFAYPFGTAKHFNDQVKSAVAENYERAFTAKPSFYLSGSDKYEIPRTCLEEEQSLASVRRWIEGGYDLFYTTKHLKR